MKKKQSPEHAPVLSHLVKSLEKRKLDNSLRKLSKKEFAVDFCSNDYLGLARSEKLHSLSQVNNFPFEKLNGSAGSRLLSGNSELFEALEEKIAKFHHAESALIFNSGYDANLGLLSCLPQKDDTVLYDELVHASIRDGIRLSHASAFSFRHNDTEHLKEKLSRASKGKVFIIVESVYSMDGDISPLKELVEIAGLYNAALIVDEAHSTGIYGENGEGLVCKMNLENKIFARVHTFGKALGTHGAAVVGSELLRNYLINFSRPFIYTTALPLHSLRSISAVYDLLPSLHQERTALFNKIHYFNNKALEMKIPVIESSSPIQGIIIPGNSYVKMMAEKCTDDNMDVRAVLSPTVPKTQERLRISLHSFNTEKEIDLLMHTLLKNL
jgi:8-amino-7-oxononanoate synthase